ncbi:IS3 family transposase [Haloechinothrix salitolerans]|uniref:IS3 family transposase n=1 Tax=Haloechinothrix salitolerans TaxID=926830 RepID=A0ABW2BY81_9PSEU
MESSPVKVRRQRENCTKRGLVPSLALSFFSTLEHEMLSRHHFTTRKEARQVIVERVVDFYNRRRRHSSCGMMSPIDYETTAAQRAA